MHARGFTLLELVIVLGLTACLLALGAVGYASLRGRLGLASATRQVASDLALARIRAIARNREQRLVFAPGATSYRPQEKSDGFDDTGPARDLPKGIRIDDCTAPNDAVSFRPRGGASSFGTITLRNADGDTRAIAVSITGRARIQ